MTNQEFLESIALPGEVWRDAVGYDNRYFVSSIGRIMSSNFHHKKQFILSQFIESNHGIRYSTVCLTNNGVQKKVRVHRIVACAFIDNPNGFKEIDHINGDGTDNRVENLVWCSRRQNMNNPITKQRLSLSCKRKTGIFTKRSTIIAKIKDGVIISLYDRIADVVKDGYVPSAVCAVCKGRQQSHRGYIWKYYNS